MCNFRYVFQNKVYVSASEAFTTQNTFDKQINAFLSLDETVGKYIPP